MSKKIVEDDSYDILAEDSIRENPQTILDEDSIVPSWL